MSTATDLAEAREMYTLYLNAEKAILGGQAYSIGDRQLTRAELRTVSSERAKWRAKMDALTAGTAGARVMRVVPHDD